METANSIKNDWWKKAVFYHIIPASFLDTNSDGIGNIQGIISKLDYLQWLGIDAVWLSPFYCSPFIDMGYDITDHTCIDPRFGNREDIKRLIHESHNRNIKVVVDLIMNHTSDQHAWFQQARSSKENPKHNWYIWKKSPFYKKPNNWKSVFGGSGWEYDKSINSFYYHTFFKQQPDLNWRNKELQAEFFNIVHFWLELGVDGFRLDAINFIIKDKKLRKSPTLIAQLLGKENYINRNRPRSYKILKQLRIIVDQYPGTVLIGEIYTLPPGNPVISASYLSFQDRLLDLTFDFSLLFKKWSAKKYFTAVGNWMKSIPEGAWPAHVLSNHDLNRRINYNSNQDITDRKAKVLATFLLTLQGTPFIYYGDEIGMNNAEIPRKLRVDPLGKGQWFFYKGRDRSRTPMQWNGNENAGFTDYIPWLPVNKDYINRNIENQLNNNDSVLMHYQKLIALRKSLSVLQSGEWVPLLNGKQGIIIYCREKQAETLIIILNFSGSQKKISLPGYVNGVVIHSTHRNTGMLFEINKGIILPYEATILNNLK
ncbi:MAG: alpha-glucosidase [Bacteroidales bacterium]